MTYTATVECDDVTGDFLVVLPPDLLVAVGWRQGDTVEWTIEDDCLCLKRVTET